MLVSISLLPKSQKKVLLDFSPTHSSTLMSTLAKLSIFVLQSTSHEWTRNWIFNPEHILLFNLFFFCYVLLFGRAWVSVVGGDGEMSTESIEPARYVNKNKNTHTMNLFHSNSHTQKWVNLTSKSILTSSKWWRESETRNYGRNCVSRSESQSEDPVTRVDNIYCLHKFLIYLHRDVMTPVKSHNRDIKFRVYRPWGLAQHRWVWHICLCECQPPL